MDTSQIETALKAVKYPGFSRDIISFGLVKNIEFQEGVAKVHLALTTGDPRIPTQVKADVENVLAQLDGVTSADVSVVVSKPKTPPPASGDARTVTGPAQQALPGVKHIIAVASGKGGVGKSTFAVNLACALDRVLTESGRKRRVGLMDCDIYGPSTPLMMGVSRQPEIQGEMLIPVENFNVRVMSMGLLVDEHTPVVWRGPMIMKTIQQFAANVEWGELDFLIVDLPPGTGDAQLSLVQTLPLRGAIIVTTPQAAAVNVARRGAMMFGKVNVPLIGVAENMSYLEGADGARQYIFGQGGGRRTAQALETDFLGEVPLDPLLREGSDLGIPIVISDPQRPASQAFMKIAERLKAEFPVTEL
ncbi:Mrp/NBP35 family ATP-binding protein [Cerasicoccus arenae]|uniref:Iron-sulfur cluster carrier protein n=1 Tax=Cerasicoccus arenae TaxID=424488 RepID=A0A8J3DDU4_9BACT|nr:Mrp/NBP35 family ATP-binding protein [Cerasicoccus arenae]MBK1858773.1 Mrp/NBP35 family ATP-binding protein [Cerasicoccus arenae]GHC07381.1 iron-sulfur cluster carrier protein [Cerasicoccus arenae]